MWQTTLANGNASLGLNHTSSPLVGQNTRGKNGGKEGHDLTTPIDLSMVPSLGTQAEKQRVATESSEINHLNNHITTPERTSPTEIENENGTTPPHRIRNHMFEPQTVGV